MKIATKDFLKKYDKFMKTKENSYISIKSNIAEAIKNPNLESINEKEFRNCIEKSKFVEYDFVRVKKDYDEIKKAIKIFSLWNKAEFIYFTISHNNKFSQFDEIISVAQKYFNNFQIATFEDNSLNDEMVLGFYMIY